MNSYLILSKPDKYYETALGTAEGSGCVPVICCSLYQVPLKPTPRVFSRRTQVMVWVFIPGSSMLPYGHDSIFHRLDVMDVVSDGLVIIDV